MGFALETLVHAAGLCDRAPQYGSAAGSSSGRLLRINDQRYVTSRRRKMFDTHIDEDHERFKKRSAYRLEIWLQPGTYTMQYTMQGF